MSSRAWPRSAAPYRSLPQDREKPLAGSALRAFALAPPVGCILLCTSLRGCAAQPLPACRAGRTAQNLIFFLFLNYGHRKEGIYTGAPWFIKNPPRLAVRSPWRAFLLIICSPRKRPQLLVGGEANAGTARTKQGSSGISKDKIFI